MLIHRKALQGALDSCYYIEFGKDFLCYVHSTKVEYILNLVSISVLCQKCVRGKDNAEFRD